MSFRIVPFSTRQEWLALRRSGIGASDISGIMGISPWTTPFQVWASKVGNLREVMDDEAMRWGRILEDVILEEWARQTAVEIKHRQPLIRNLERPFMVATPDALPSYPAVVEVKNNSDWAWTEPPAHYYAQVQWQLAVTGYKLGDLVVLHAGRQMMVYPIEANAEYQARQIEAAEDFWKHVEANEPPSTKWEDSAVMAHLWPYSTEQTVEVGPDAALELYEARSARDAGNERYEAATAAVKVMMKEADTAVCGQQVVAKWSTNKNGTRRFVVKGDELND